MKKIALVTPWYGANIPGGSEAASRNLAEKINEAGLEVEVLTTCVKQFASDWNHNYYKPGIEIINGIQVKRFNVKKRNTELFDSINLKLINQIDISEEEERVFLNEMINSSDLVDFIKKNKDEYTVFLFMPYMFGTTYNGIKQLPEKSILIPAFHDENYAYFKKFRELYSQVRGMIFFSDAEKDWAVQHYDLTKTAVEVLGLGIEYFEPNASRFREKFSINEPFLLYAGRKDHGKNVHILLNHMERYHRDYGLELKLVMIGGGQIDIPPLIKDWVFDLGFIDSSDKYDAMAAAEFLCNPSPNESFSLVIMESWLAGTPVLVNEKCEVTKRFCEISNGGLYYNNQEEFIECWKLLVNNKKFKEKLSNNGRKYVLNNFTWDKVTANYIHFIESTMGE
ncbi:glycosyltransferase family 4 protein [Paenibacillus sp. D51F]